MADYCAPLAECTGLDSRLLINRTVYGPALALESADMSRSVTTKSVHIFMGTKIEAVPGTCVMPDLPTP